jgi:hypothetical protein
MLAMQELRLRTTVRFTLGVTTALCIGSIGVVPRPSISSDMH